MPTQTGVSWHVLVEAALAGALVYILAQRRERVAPAPEPTPEEVDDMCEAWNPAPLVAPEDLDVVVWREDRVVTHTEGTRVTVAGIDALDFASFDFLGMGRDSAAHDAAEAAIRKYGVGPCGPRGFYGTMDVHLALERDLADFFGTEGGIVYSYDLATAPSIVAAFLRRGDLILHDEALHASLRLGVSQSRADVLEFRHNDLDHLQDLMLAANDAAPRTPLNRRFVVVEGIYANSGTLSPLPEIVALAEAYCFRVLLDESMSLGVLGATGRGACEHHGVPASALTLVCASMSTALGSIGGFAVAGAAVTAHQRLSSTGYCFSASLPPFHAVAASQALQRIAAGDAGVATLQARCAYLHAALAAMLASSHADRAWLLGDAPAALKHVHLVDTLGSRREDTAFLHRIADRVLVEAACALVVADYSPLEPRAPRASLRVAVHAKHTERDLDRLVAALDRALHAAFQKP